MSEHQHTAECRSRIVRDEEMITVNSWDDVPSFANECEEHVYWGKHSLGPALLEQFRPVGDDGAMA